VNSLPKTVARQRLACDLNPGPTALESSTLNTLPPSHVSMPHISVIGHCIQTLLPGCIQPHLISCPTCRLPCAYLISCRTWTLACTWNGIGFDGLLAVD